MPIVLEASPLRRIFVTCAQAKICCTVLFRIPRKYFGEKEFNGNGRSTRIRLGPFFSLVVWCHSDHRPMPSRYMVRPEQKVEQTSYMLVIWDTITLMSRYCRIIINYEDAPICGTCVVDTTTAMYFVIKQSIPAAQGARRKIKYTDIGTKARFTIFNFHNKIKVISRRMIVNNGADKISREKIFSNTMASTWP